MGIKEALANLNEIKNAGLIQDYAIGGGYAVTFYDVPQATYDLDVFVMLSSEDEYHRLYEHFKTNGAKIECTYIFIGDMPVQFLPNYISPLCHDAIKEAKQVEFDGIRTRFVSLEYLILLLLTSFRPKDRIRIGRLLIKADSNLLLSLIKRFDDEQKTLSQRYKSILERT